MADENDHHEHRKRLRSRFLKGGGEALHDYELLELVLFLAIPRKDTKPIAKALIKRFGGYAETIAAEPDALRAVEGVGEAAAVAIKSIGAAAERLAREQVMNRPVLSSWDRLLAYLRIGMGHKPTEQFRILLLDARNILIADEAQQEGTVNHKPVYPREVIKRALELGATAIIMVHNHPSGDPTPSQADIAMTREVMEAGARLGIALHDHVIITRARHASFKALGLI
ncbi:MAG: JAB domain-containing protein [Alphaproteobacteria bacterium]|nr:JAB domain-containing protein [Alphaproteobacteria bacterium]